jgi:hypothetical protein
MGNGDVGGQYNSLEIGRALYGFQNMQAELCPDVKLIFAKMRDAVRNMKGPLLCMFNYKIECAFCIIYTFIVFVVLYVSRKLVV